MKLFTRYNRINLVATVLIFLLASTAYYFLLRYVFIYQLDENLKIEEDEIVNYVQKYHRLPEVIPVKDQQITYTPVARFSGNRYFKTAISYDRVEKETGSFRQLYFCISVDGKLYQVVVGKSMEGTENLIQSIIVITVATILLILTASLVINRIVLRKLWLPFYRSLEVLRNFQVGKKQKFELPQSTVEEFQFMNTVLTQAAVKADEDYLLLKEFTENASHEMQTPLAIIRSKLDILIQDEYLSRQQGFALQGVYEAIQKLSRLNRSLLLLAKIENRQFEEPVAFNLKEKVEEKLLQLQEILQDKNLQVTAELSNVTVTMNTELVEILLNNLVSNAIRHNVNSGRISIELNGQRQLIIKNTGAGNPLDKSRLFTRFNRPTQNPDHTGLGLSIIKQICNVSGCTISYDFDAGTHIFTLVW